MVTLPSEMTAVLQPFAPAFSKRVWERTQVLVVGAILMPGQCTVALAAQGDCPLVQGKVVKMDAWTGAIQATFNVAPNRPIKSTVAPSPCKIQT